MFNWFKQPKKQEQLEMRIVVNNILSGDEQKALDSYRKYVSLKMNEIGNRGNPFWH